jgi:hypothetical protein
VLGLIALRVVEFRLEPLGAHQVTATDARLILDILWAHAPVAGAPEHIWSRAAACAVELSLLISDSAPDPVSQAWQLLEEAAKASGFLANWRAVRP